MKHIVYFVFLVFLPFVKSFDVMFYKLWKTNAEMNYKRTFLNIASKLLCATACEENGCSGFIYTGENKCQMLFYRDEIEKTGKGRHELWVIDEYSKTIEPQEIILVDLQSVYWYRYNLEYTQLLSNMSGPISADWDTFFYYDKKSQLCYWLVIGSGLHSAVLTKTKITSHRKIIPKGAVTVNFDIDMARGMYFLLGQQGSITWRTLKKRKRHIVYRGGGKDAIKPRMITLDTSSQRVHFATLKGLYRVNYNGAGLQKMKSVRGVTAMYYDSAGSTLYWSSEVKGGVIMRRREGKGRESTRVMMRNAGYVDQIIVYRKLIFYNTLAKEGIDVLTVDGTRLPQFATDKIIKDRQMVMNVPR